MNVTTLFLLRVVLLACVGMFGSAFAGSNPNPPSLTTTPNPPPADQEFAAVFHFHSNPAVAGFWGEAHPSSHTNGNVITFFFDEGCGFLCPPEEPVYVAHPFTMPALPAGTYIIRIANGFESTSTVYGEFTINVGGGVVGPTALPVGGYASLLLTALMIVLATGYLRHKHLNPKAVI